MRIGKKTKVAKELTRQERNRRNNIKRLTISAIVAFILFICLIVIQSSILNQEEKSIVYQVKTDIPAGTKITESNMWEYLAKKEVQLSLIPADPVTSKDQVVDKFVNKNYKAKDVITIDGVTDTEKLYKDSIENPVEISFSIDGLAAGVAGTIREGEYVNIYGIRKIVDEEPNVYGYEENLFTVDDIFTFKHVYISKAFNNSGTRVTTAAETGSILSTQLDVPTTMFNVILDEKDVELFNTMLKNCDIKLVKLLYDTDTDYQDFLTKTNKQAAKVEVNKNTDSESDTETEGKPWYELVIDELNTNETSVTVDETSTEAPVETPTETPVETPVEIPTEIPTGTPVETPVETPTGTPVETPVETPTGTPVETPES